MTLGASRLKTRTRTRSDVAVRRGQIIDEAIRVVGQRGSHGLTIHEIAQRCGLSNAGLLHHFPSKEELLLASLQELEKRETAVIAPLVEALTDQQNDGTASIDDLFMLLHTMVSRAASNAELDTAYLVLQAESLDRNHAAHASFLAREAAVLDLFAKLTAPHVPDPASTARQMLATIDGLNQQWVRSGKAFDIVAEWDRAIRTILMRGPAQTKKRK